MLDRFRPNSPPIPGVSFKLKSSKGRSGTDTSPVRPLPRSSSSESFPQQQTDVHRSTHESASQPPSHRHGHHGHSHSHGHGQHKRSKKLSDHHASESVSSSASDPLTSLSYSTNELSDVPPIPPLSPDFTALTAAQRPSELAIPVPSGSLSPTSAAAAANPDCSTTQLVRAVEQGGSDAVQRFLATCSVHDVNRLYPFVPSDGGKSPPLKRCSAPLMVVAAAHGRNEIVKMLYLAGASVDEPNSEGYTPLNVAARNGHLAVVELLLAVRCDRELPERLFQRTPLSSAVSQGHASVVETLLAGGCNRDASAMGWTPLLEAADRGDRDIVALLLTAGADRTITLPAWNTGRSARKLAKLKNHLDVVALFDAQPSPPDAVRADTLRRMIRASSNIVLRYVDLQVIAPMEHRMRELEEQVERESKRRHQAEERARACEKDLLQEVARRKEERHRRRAAEHVLRQLDGEFKVPRPSAPSPSPSPPVPFPPTFDRSPSASQSTSHRSTQSTPTISLIHQPH